MKIIKNFASSSYLGKLSASIPGGGSQAMNFQQISSTINHGAFCDCCSTLGLLQPQQKNKRNLTTFDGLTTFEGTDYDEICQTTNIHVRKLLENNRKWIKDMNEKDPEYLQRLKQPQNPKYLYIGCSDSRVPANQILGLG